MEIPARQTHSTLSWRVLGLFNLFGLLSPMVAAAAFWLSATSRAAESNYPYPMLFIATAAAYFAFACVGIVGLKKRWPPLKAQVIAHLVLNSAAIALLLIASGGMAGGLGILIVIPVAAASLLLERRQAYLVAAVCTLIIIGQELLAERLGHTDQSYLAAAGVVGVIIFLFATAGAVLATRLLESEALVRQRDVDLADLAELSQYIIQRMRESIVVVDASDRIRLINESAAQILGAASAMPGALLGEVSPKLLYFLANWRRDPQEFQETSATFIASDGARVVQPHFAALGSQPPAPILVFLEDTSLLAEKVQQSKLAALGRLSASIAHEIRNPIAAMSHAGQLLSESPALGPEELRLTDIIRTNSERVNTIINNVLKLSRRDATHPEKLKLGDWLHAFAEEFIETMQVPESALAIADPEGDIEVSADPSHLHQVLWNLCDNALKYGTQGNGETHGPSPVEVRWGRAALSARPYLEVCDRGPGIGPDNAEKIFEPFFTGQKGGTGLGLFLARELCQCNGAILIYEARQGGGSIFRVVFADPQRWTG
jgi:two-component system sensor histidine kinase PilS (NtrC family)